MNLKLGRNDPCHCGSGRKYKKCHLAADEAREHEEATARAAAPALFLPERPIQPPAPLPILPNLPPAEKTPEALAEEAFWARFAGAAYPERLAIFAEELAA